ncbi:MAG: serine hydrolase [Nocardioidaceae bacterium]|nr:serine hydrolase [Nocardioidaceae bacterium]
MSRRKRLTITPTRKANAIVLTVALLLAVGPAAVGDRRSIEERGRQKAAQGTATRAADVTAADLRFPHSGRQLRYGTPREARLVAEHVEQISTDLRAFLEPSPVRPMYAGGVVLAARNGVIAVHDAAGQAVRYADAETELPPEEWVPARTDTIYDLASVTKTFTAIAVMQQVEAGSVELDEPVATYLPDFAQAGKEDVTIRDLLTHTGGLPAWVPLYSRYATVEERLAALLAIEPIAERGERYVYSDLGLITLGLVVEAVTGESLDTVISDRITEPLEMHDTMFNPPESVRDRIAATEAEPWAGRPMIRGEVHDENAWSLGGVAGHAGLFSTAHDMAVLAQTLLNGGRYGGVRILDADTVRAMLTNENTAFPANSHGLGFELNQRWYMDAMSSPVTFGHTGYTGTSLVVDPLADSFVVLLANRVHPTRDWGSNNPSRRAVARDLARAVAVHPAEGPAAWFSGLGDSRTASLTLPVTPASAGAATVQFALWYDTEAGYDIATFETSADGGQTWTPVPFTLRSPDGVTATDGTVSGYSGRRWHDVAATLDLGGGEQLLRWRYATDGLYQGRGVYVDAIRVVGPDGQRLDDSSRLRPDGFTLSRN